MAADTPDATTCGHCGAAIPPRSVLRGQARRYCSSRCAKNAQNKRTKQKPEAKARHGALARAKYRAANPFPETLPCKGCGVAFRPVHARAVYCAPQCYPPSPTYACTVEGCALRSPTAGKLCGTHAGRMRKWGTLEPAGPQAAARARRRRVCGVCAAPFECDKADARKPTHGRFCSVACRVESTRVYDDRNAEREAQREARRRREAATGGVKINRQEVFERDGWRCYLCGDETLRADPTRRHPKAPTVDHAVPLSKGGAHSLDNLLCAHRGCNTRKSTRPWFECTVMMA